MSEMRRPQEYSKAVSVCMGLVTAAYPTGNFNGVYIDGEGVALQIQRREGGSWSDFPVQANVRGGVFSTWIQTSRTGEQRFRVADPTTDRVSNVVRITIG